MRPAIVLTEVRSEAPELKTPLYFRLLIGRMLTPRIFRSENDNGNYFGAAQLFRCHQTKFKNILLGEVRGAKHQPHGRATLLMCCAYETGYRVMEVSVK